MKPVYNQKNLSITVDGILLQGFFEGASVTITHDGGEVDKTQGTDGASINIATDQGLTLKVTLKETSPSLSFLTSLKKRQYLTNIGSMITIRSGADVLHTMPDSFVSSPGELSTGDKKMGGIDFTFMSATSTTSNLGAS